MIAIYKRELFSYFRNMTGPIFAAVNLLFLGIYFTAYHLSFGYPYIAYTVQSSLFIFLMVTPILTMKSLAEERRQKTDQLLLTAPVSIGKIVVGKYLAMLTVFMIPVALVCLYPLFLSHYGSVPMAEAYVAILGYLIFGMACIAVGTFVSSLTDNLIIAAVGTFAILLLGYLMQGIESIVSQEGNLLTKIMSIFDIMTPMNDLMQGMLNLTSVLYYLTVTLLMLFLTYEVIQKRRYQVSRKTLSLSVFSSVMVLVAVAAAVLVNFGASKIPTNYTHIDVTDNKLYELTSTTKEYLKNLNDDITIYVLISKENCDSTISKTLDGYEAYSNRVKVVYKNPATAPDFAKSYGVEDARTGSVIVVSDKRSKYINYDDLYSTEINYETYQEEATGFDGEGQITSAIDYVLSGDMPRLYVIQGHDEAELSASMISLIGKGNYETEDLNLMSVDAVPEDAAAIIMVAPTVDYSSDDLAKVTEYLDKGGKAFMVSSYTQGGLKNFESIVGRYGVSLQEGLVAEGDDEHYYQSPYYLLPQLGTDTTTAGIVADKRLVIVPYAQGAVVPAEPADNVNITKLLTTTDSSYAKTDVSTVETSQKEEGDVDGPFTVGMMIEDTDNGSEILYFTSVSIINESADEMVGGANTELVMNGITEMVGSKESSISIPVKNYDIPNITVARSSAISVGILVVLVLPLSVLIFGFVIWIRRRKK